MIPTSIAPTKSKYAKPIKLPALQRLEALGPGVQLDHVLRLGDPVQEILDVAQDRQCDVIVMGTRGRTGLGRVLMGSVAEKVVRRAPCPVLTVRVPLSEVPG
jgi:nucleotide-binding universal stress UspA family protein